jgi:serine/threonine protein kinase
MACQLHVAEDNSEISRVGTRKYMPPDGRMDARADIYAAGLVIYEMTTGLPAESFPRPGQWAPQSVDDPILGALTRLCLRACRPDPRERFQDAGEMLAQLEAADPQAVTRGARTRRRTVAAAAGAAVVLLLAPNGFSSDWR